MKGLFAALLVGIAGSAMSLGFEQGLPVDEYAEKAGVNPLFTTMPVMLLIAFRHACYYHYLVFLSWNQK